MSRLIYSFGKVYKMNGPLKNISSKMHHRVPVKCSYIYLKTTTTMSHPYVLRGCLQNILLTVFLVLKYRRCMIFVKLEVYNFFRILSHIGGDGYLKYIPVVLLCIGILVGIAMCIKYR